MRRLPGITRLEARPNLEQTMYVSNRSGPANRAAAFTG